MKSRLPSDRTGSSAETSSAGRRQRRPTIACARVESARFRARRADDDPIHFNYYRAQRMASELANALIRSGVLDSTAFASRLLASPPVTPN